MLAFNLWTPAFIILASLSHTQATCTKFTQAGDYFTRTASSSQRISPEYICSTPNSDYIDGSLTQQRCNASTQCPIKSWGTVNSMGTNNISLSEEQVLPLYDLVWTSTTYRPLVFLYSYSDMPGNVSSCLNTRSTSSNSSAPFSGHWSFTPFLLCINGTLSSCTDGPVADGTAIEICGVSTYGNTISNPGLNGVISFVYSSGGETGGATNLTDNPAASVSPLPRKPADQTASSSPSSASGTGTGTGTPSATPTSGAGKSMAVSAEVLVVGGIVMVGGLLV